jgi:hypothetical protein
MDIMLMLPKLLTPLHVTAAQIPATYRERMGNFAEACAELESER